MSGNKRVVKFRRRRTLNIGIIVFLVMFVYIGINVYLYFTKDHITIYEVKAGTTAQDKSITGLILRDETVVKADQAGYISYFQKEGSRIAKGESVFALNDSKQIMDVITNGDNPISISKENNAQIRYEIQKFKREYSDSDFNTVYDFGEDAQSTVLDILNTTMIEEGQTIEEQTGFKYSYNESKSKKSGIVSYYLDSFEAVTPDSVTPEMFDHKDYKRTSLRTTDTVSIGDPVYKLITSEKWSIILPLSAEQYAKLTDKTQVKFRILKDDYQTAAKLTLLQNGKNYYARLTLDKLMSNYLSERYLEIELDFDSVSGLKIPVSSVVTKDFYIVPNGYFTKGANSDKKGLTVETFDEKTGDVKYSFVATDIYNQGDEFGYVDANLFELGTPIVKPDSTDEYKLSKMDELTGVYNVNLGYAVFKQVEILAQNDEYCIIADDTSNGLSAYDHIALDGKTAVDQKIIY